ncbi:MFS transporter [Actinomycetes bacterium KLBMP 9797]
MSHEAHAAERQATFREVFGESEYRVLFITNALTWFGDYLAKAAVTAMVYQETTSVGMAAAAFAVTYLPWLVGGPLLATLAERYPYKNVMIVGDLLRMVLIGVIAAVQLPTAAVLVLLFASTLVAPPAQAARSAILPLILGGDRLVVGLSINLSTGQAASIAGYLAGAGLTAYDPRMGLWVNTIAFGISAVVIRFGLRPRPAAMTEEHRSHLLRETAEGFRVVFYTPVLRAIAILVFVTMLFAIVPEGLAAGWAAETTKSEAGRGLAQAVIMAAAPVGWIIGGLAAARLLRPEVRRRLIRPFAALAPLCLVPALLNPHPIAIVIMTAACNMATAGMMPAANGLFVQALPHGYRARAFGVMQTGIQAIQGAAVLATGLLADRFSIPVVVGVWSIAGVLLIALAGSRWPSADRFNAAVTAAAATMPPELRDPARQNGASAAPTGPKHSLKITKERSVAE